MTSRLGIAGLVMAAYLGISGSQLSAQAADDSYQYRMLPRPVPRAYIQRRSPWSMLQEHLRRTGKDYVVVRAPGDNMPIIIPNLERYGSPKDVIVPDLRKYNMPVIRPKPPYDSYVHKKRLPEPEPIF